MEPDAEEPFPERRRVAQVEDGLALFGLAEAIDTRAAPDVIVKAQPAEGREAQPAES